MITKQTHSKINQGNDSTVNVKTNSTNSEKKIISKFISEKSVDSDLIQGLMGMLG